MNSLQFLQEVWFIKNEKESFAAKAGSLAYQGESAQKPSAGGLSLWLDEYKSAGGLSVESWGAIERAAVLHCPTLIDNSRVALMDLDESHLIARALRNLYVIGQAEDSRYVVARHPDIHFFSLSLKAAIIDALEV